MKDKVEPLFNHLNSVCPTMKFIWSWRGTMPFSPLTPREDGVLDVTVIRKTYTHRLVPAIQLLPPSKCKEISRQESLRQGQECHSMEKPARTLHHYFKMERLSIILHPLHVLCHTETINTTCIGEYSATSYLTKEKTCLPNIQGSNPWIS